MSDFELISPREHDLGGGFRVRRLLPSAQRQAVGPFLFFDHFGPVTAGPADNHDVRPHPHIGLATVTYLYEGAMMHRDSTGVTQRIAPGAINWMTAGRGIVHSERTPDDLRGGDDDPKLAGLAAPEGRSAGLGRPGARLMRRIHGLQLWAALPEAHEEDEPSFEHTPAAAIPELGLDGVTLRVLIGRAFGGVSPVKTLSETLYLDLACEPGAALTIPVAAPERALYSVDAPFELDGQTVPAFTMVVLAPGTEPELRTREAARIALVGGAPLGPRFIAWNFVSSRRERIVAAQADWAAQRFARVPGETEFIPLPPR